jgi:predicted dehydrogenase
MTVQWGLLGAGDIVRKRVGAALRDATRSRLLGVARADAERAASFAREIGAERSYPGWRDLLADPVIDAVYVATPVHLHAEQVVAASEAGKHVLCEKPMALDVAECDRMIAAARAHGVRLGVAYYRHFYPLVARLKEIIASGEIGQPVLCQVNAFEWFDVPPDHPRAWFLSRAASGGGPMFDFGCHRIEVLLDLFGRAADVRGVVANVVFETRDAEDTAVAVIRFEQGTCATVAVTHASGEPRDTFEVYATRGSLHVEQLNGSSLEIRTRHGSRVESHPPAVNLHLPLVQDFVDAVLDGREPAVTGEIGHAVALVEAQIYRDGLDQARC